MVRTAGSQMGVALALLLVGAGTGLAMETQAAAAPDRPDGLWTGAYVGIGLSTGILRDRPAELALTINGVESDPLLPSPLTGQQILAGLSWQADRGVTGVEGEFDLSPPEAIGPYDLDTHTPRLDTVTGLCADSATYCLRLGMLGSLDVLGRARAHAGVELVPGLLLFGAAGMSMAQASLRGIYVAFGEVGASGGMALSLPRSRTDRIFGASLGLGAQMSLGNHVSVRAEILEDLFAVPLRDDVEVLMNADGVEGRAVYRDKVALDVTTVRLALLSSF